MATAPDPNEDDSVLDLTEEQIVTDPDGDTPADDDLDPNVNDDAGEDETVISFGDDPDEAKPDDSSEIRRLRERNKELNQRVREIERGQSAPAKIEVGEKPTLAGCDYDEDRYEAERDAWDERKRQAEEQDSKAAEASKAITESWAAAKQKYDASAAKHGFADIADDEALVDAALGQFAPVILKAAQDPALMVRALGRNPAKLEELAKLKDPFEIAAAVARMEGSVKMVTKRKAPNIDTPQRGAAVIESSDKTLERLEAEADKTGNRTKVIEYKRQLKAKGK